MTWFYNSGFAPNLYRRWLGLKVNNDGGEEFELTPDLSKDGSSVNNMRGGEGRMCLPPMLLHPVKDVGLPIEANPEELHVPEAEMGRTHEPGARRAPGLRGTCFKRSMFLSVYIEGRHTGCQIPALAGIYGISVSVTGMA